MEEELICTCKTTYDEALYKALNVNMFKWRIIISLCFCVLLEVVGILMLLLKFSEIIGWVYIGCGIAIPIAILILFTFATKKAIKANIRMQGVVDVEYSFYTNHVELKVTSEKLNGNSKFKYTDYYKFKNLKDYYFLFLTSNQSQVVET